MDGWMDGQMAGQFIDNHVATQRYDYYLSDVYLYRKFLYRKMYYEVLKTYCM